MNLSSTFLKNYKYNKYRLSWHITDKEDEKVDKLSILVITAVTLALLFLFIFCFYA